jgi:hypothetical protein
MPEPTSALAIRKSLDVGVPVETAFRVFTEEIGSWWPLASKSVALEDAADLVVEPRVDASTSGRAAARSTSGARFSPGNLL